MVIKAKAVIFDRDGVIIDSDTLVGQSIIYGLREIGIDVPEDDIPPMAGKSVDTLRDSLLSKWNFNFDEFRAIQRKYFYDNLDNAPYYTDMVGFIKDLHAQNKILALTTSAGREGTTLILKKIGINDMFNVIIAKEDCAKLKPDPEPYLKTAEMLGVSPEDCIVIEDSAIGVEAAKKANMKCIAIPNKHTNKQDFSIADLVASSVEDIKNNILIS